MDVPVQGNTAAEKIAQALRDMNDYGKVDCVIVGRGGGSIEDLWAFNEEVVARAIYASTIPVISAIGHEIDFTISDFVADARAATPSAAAEMAVTDDEQDNRYFLARAKYFLSRFFTLHANAQSAYKTLLRRPGLSRVSGLLREARQKSDEVSADLNRSFYHAFKNFRQQNASSASRLHSLSPLNTLSRGYSVVTNARGKTVKNSGMVSQGDLVDIRFFEGKAIAEIQETFE
jgi:exodeoxyribonuclease VII large subunit